MIERTEFQKGMTVTVCIDDDRVGPEDLAAVADWLETIDQRFRPFLATSEVSRLNAGALGRHEASEVLAAILLLCEQTREETGDSFDPMRNGRFDPSRLIKGWAIERAAAPLAARGFAHYFVDAGGTAIYTPGFRRDVC
jgi:thiamine biosynthesis lipoprotein